MKILFIASKHGGVMSQGIMYLSAILKKNKFETYYLNTYNYRKVSNFIKENKPDLLAYSTTSGEYKYYNNLNKKLKNFGIMSVIGGPHATFFGKEFMKQKSNSFDAACVGEGEYAMLDLCKSLRDGKNYYNIKNWIFKKPNGKIVINKLRPLIDDLDELPFPDFKIDPDMKNLKRVIFWLHRGCPSNCTYCMNHKWRELYRGLGKIIRVPTPRYCIEMIKHRISLSSEKPERILFEDDNFGIDIKWLKKFAKLYKKEIGLPWEAHLYPTLITAKRIKIMADAGCKIIETAIETGNEKRRRELLKRPMTNEQIQDSIDIIHENGIGVRIQNILLLPGETYRTALETFRLNASCKPEVATTSKFQPYPGLELTKKAI